MFKIKSVCILLLIMVLVSFSYGQSLLTAYVGDQFDIGVLADIQKGGVDEIVFDVTFDTSLVKYISYDSCNFNNCTITELTPGILTIDVNQTNNFTADFVITKLKFEAQLVQTATAANFYITNVNAKVDGDYIYNVSVTIGSVTIDIRNKVLLKFIGF